MILPPHPEPPPDLAKLRLPMCEMTADLWRIHPVGRTPLHFGRMAHHRFDAPHRDYGVLYVAAAAKGAFIETFGQATGIRVLAAAELAQAALCRITASRPLRLVDLTGSGLARLGADARLTSANHEPARRWSAALHAHPDRVDGLTYRARHDPEQTCVALFERCQDTLQPHAEGALLDAGLAAMVRELLAEYDFGLA